MSKLKVLKSGRKLFRHPNEQGSVLVYKFFGKRQSIFIPDAKFRTVGELDCAHDRAPSVLPRISTATTGEWNAPNAPLGRSRDDDWLAANYPELAVDGTARENTTNILAYQRIDENRAPAKCRALSFKGLGACDLPNLYQTLVIFFESDNIDALDPTLSDYPERSLGAFGGTRRFTLDPLRSRQRVWTSTVFNDRAFWFVSSTGRADHEPGKSGGIVPVIELAV